MYKREIAEELADRLSIDKDRVMVVIKDPLDVMDQVNDRLYRVVTFDEINEKYFSKIVYITGKN